MTSSLLQGKQFYCREWAFTKIQQWLEKCLNFKTYGVLILGGPGCGKTAMCCELVSPACIKQGKQFTLCKYVLASYFCQAHDIETLSIRNFIKCVIEQIARLGIIRDYDKYINSRKIQELLSLTRCEQNPDETFHLAVVEPLRSAEKPAHNMLMVVDSIDESYLKTITKKTLGHSSTVAELLANHHRSFPDWLLLICSARKQSKSVTHLFTGFRKITLDDLRKHHVVRDVQNYILSRLDREPHLRQHLSRETAEMLNQLHIKSNGCVLYLEKVLDGVADGFISLQEIRDIPGTLNGLYLWLCQRLFVDTEFSCVQPIFNVILAARRPLTETELYSCIYNNDISLVFSEFKILMHSLSRLVINGTDHAKIFFHHSFAEWLLDVKYCTQKYQCTVSEGHTMLAMSFTMHGGSLMDNEIKNLAFHLARSSLKKSMGDDLLVLWLLHSGANVESCINPSDQSRTDICDLIRKATNEMAVCNIEGDSTADKSSRSSLDSVSIADDSSSSAKLFTPGGCMDMSKLWQASHDGNLDTIKQIISEHPNQINSCDGNGWTALRTASWMGHLDIVAYLLHSSASVDQCDHDQRTALRAASWAGHYSVVCLLLEHGAQVNHQDHQGRTPLSAAAYMGHTEIVLHLLEAGADINLEDRDGRTALFVAALCATSKNNHNMVRLLLDHGSMVDHVDRDGLTTFLALAHEGDVESCEILLDDGADVDHTDHTGRSALQLATSAGNSPLIDLLLLWGAAVDSIDADGRTVLCQSAQQGNIDIVGQFLCRGLDEMHRDNFGWTPLHIAAYEGHKEVIDLLVTESGARVTEVDNEGRMALLLAAQEGHLGAVESLIHVGSPVNAHAHDGKTALRAAALENHQQVVQFLLINNADFNYKDADGRSTLYVLALENRVEVAGFLLDSGAHVESSDLEGRTPLHVSSWQGHVEMVEKLLLYKADVNGVDNDQRSALQSAAWQGHTSVVHELIKHGAIVDHTCNQGATALCIAAQEGHKKVVQALLLAGAKPNHADQFGRTAMRVALKGNHLNVVKLLESYGVSSQIQPSPGALGSTGQISTAPTVPSREHKPIKTSKIAPNETDSKAKKKTSHKSKGAANKTNGTSSDQHQQPSNGVSNGSDVVPSTTQEVKGIPGSPLLASPLLISPSGKQISKSSDLSSVHITSNPQSTSGDGTSATLSSQDDSNVWQRLEDEQTLDNKSPDSRRKRTGIMTNPNYAKAVSINGYFNKLANLQDTLDNYSENAMNGNTHPSKSQSLKTAASQHQSNKRPVRPQKLHVKKETPL